MRREAQAGPWRISVTFGPIPADVVHMIALNSEGGRFVLDYRFGNSGAPGISAAEHMRNRDAEIDAAIEQFELSPDWIDPASLYISVVAQREIPCPVDLAEFRPRHFWIPDATADALAVKYRDEASAMLGFGIARTTMGPPYRHSGSTHPGCPRYVVTMAEMEPCPLSSMRGTAKATVTRSTWVDAADRFANSPFDLTEDAKLAEYKAIGQIGMWHLAAYNESDSFRRFMWSYIGLEVLISAVATAGRGDFTTILGKSATLGEEVIRDLLWPPNTANDDPNRSIRFRFALAAALLSPNSAADDVEAFRKLNQFRNNIHGRMVPGAEAPAIEAFRLFEQYAILATEYLGSAESDGGAAPE
ncbi:hypothetical protein [Pseudonocardia sp. N23]|uniref:hypothetical protein n=1 Tax=Pseudonocardia sp. N23 TaxID=1987376 RepID=UPI0011456F2E|nr:hypothetical protein [Pseudonocardia sp. N23]